MLGVGVALLRSDVLRILAPGEVAGVLKEPEEVALESLARDPVGPCAVIEAVDMDERREQGDSVLFLLMPPDIEALLGVFERLDAVGRDLPDLVGEVQPLDASLRFLERFLKVVEHGKGSRAEVLSPALEKHLQYWLAEGVLSPLSDEVGDLVMLDHLDDGVGHMDELIVPVRFLPSPVASVFEEVLGADIAKIVLVLLVFPLLHGPEHLILFQRLGALQFVLVVELPAPASEGELRKIAKLLDVPLAKVVRALEFPELHDLAVREGRDLVQLHPLTGAGLLVLGCGDVCEQLLLLTLEGVGQQVIGTFVFGHVLADMAEVQLDIDIVVLELGKIVLEVAHGVEEVARALLDGVGQCRGVGDVVAVGVEHKHDLLDLAPFHQGDDVIRERSVVADVLNTGHCDGHDAMLAGFLRLFLALLDEEGRQFFACAVCLADCLRVIHESRRPHGAAVLDRSLVLVEMTVRMLVSDAEVGLLDLFLADLHREGDRSALKIVVFDDRVVSFLVDLPVFGESAGDEGAEGGDCLVVPLLDCCRHIGIGQSGLGEHPLAEVARLRFLRLLALFLVLDDHAVVAGQVFDGFRIGVLPDCHQEGDRVLAGEISA